ncbi:MAG: type VII secretion protein EccCb [Lapillicoccus sp.]
MTTTTSTPRRGSRIPPPPRPQGDLQLDPPPTVRAGEGLASTMVMALVPMLAAVGSIVVVATSGRGSVQGYLGAGLFLLGSVGFAAATLWRSRSGRSTSVREARHDYVEHLREARGEVRAAVTRQRAHARWVHPPPPALAALVAQGTRVWERSPPDEDWLTVRFGTGAQPLGLHLVTTPTSRSERRDPVAAAALSRFVEAHAEVSGLPASVRLDAYARLEITGEAEHARALARSLITQAATFHDPARLIVAVLASPAALLAWDWVKWLPHAHSRRADDVAGPRRLVTSDVGELLRLLPEEVADRPGFDASDTVVDGPHVLLVLDDTRPAPDHGLLRPEGRRGLTVIDLPREWGDLAGDDRLRLHLDDQTDPILVSQLAPRELPRAGPADLLSTELARAIARGLMPRWTGSGPGRTELSSRDADLLELLNLPDPPEPPEPPAGGDSPAAGTDHRAALGGEPSWRPRSPRDHLRVPIGVDIDGATVALDLKESAQQGMGPHGLVIGATGSGKSELLRTLVLGLALTHSPEALNVVLVDFKGGATFAGLAGMPHVSAVITNLADDLTLVDRMQDAVTGEMTRRQELLRSAGNYASLHDYERARASGRAPHLVPLPSLLIVCDEFSELLSARPELVDLFVAIGRLGRSLGIHLLLASQRLEEGRLRGLDSHLSYRIGLRTFSSAESRSVIGVADAYELPAVPGLALLRQDPATLVRFKAAYVSGPAGHREVAHNVAPGHQTPQPVVAFTTGEVTTALVAPKTAAGAVAPDPPSEPHSILDVAVARMEGHGPGAHRVWLPPLDTPDTLDTLLPDLAVDSQLGLVSRVWRRAGGLRLPLGTVDRPRDQRQDAYVVDLSGAGGHVAVVGRPRSGKSTLLRTLVSAIALTHTPLEAQVYVVDLGGGTFTGLRDLPHVSGTASRAEPDVIARIVAELVGITDAREAFFRAHEIDTIETYRRRRAAQELDDGWGEVFLVVDGWGALRTELPDLELQLQSLAQRCLTFGVHLLTSAARWMDYRAGIRDVLGTRVELRLGDAMDSEIDRRLVASIPPDRPGRGVVASRHHLLVALPRIDGDGDASTLGAGVASMVAHVAEAWTGRAGPRLRLLPAHVDLEAIRDRGAATGTASQHLLLGITERTLAPIGLDIDRDPHLIVLGDPASGKSALLRTYVREVTRRHTPATAQLFILDYRRAHLGEYDDAFVADYATGADSARTLVGELVGVLRSRLPGPDVTPAQLRERSWWSGKEVFVIVDDHELVATSLGNPLEGLMPLLAQARDVGLHLVVARRTGGSARVHDPLIATLRDLAQPAVLLSGDPAEGALVGAPRPTPAPPGRGRLLTRAGDDVIQVAWSPSRHG